MPNNPVKPSDVLADDQDYKKLRGVKVRKGTIFAAMQNMALLKSGSEAEKEAALAMLGELAPALVALGVHEHFQCRDPEVQKILDRAAIEMTPK